MYNKSLILIQLEAKPMKQSLAILATIIVYSSSVLLIDSALAADHHNNASQQESYQHDNHDHDNHEKMTRSFAIICAFGADCACIGK